ncbi:probable tRNA methyltransferase 9B [Penaeus indicus]|uniref:probable tRNA methyltransferase 9B n=1 Tax=Penaeus indicus TaxID=29960 RepID=UPI00300C0DB9
MSPEESRKEREARSLALERAYVHDVYDQISAHFSSARYRAWPRVRQFLTDLEPGAFVADVGCGNGKYLHINQQVFKVGVDRCFNLTGAARERDHEVMVSDNLALPFRDESFDAALSIAVIHHFATTERRVRALRELARILKIGGRLMISVWAMEQRHRKFESQDVLVPWHRPEQSSSDDKASSVERDLNSTTTDDDDVLHYHAHNHSDSDSCPSNSR